MIPDLLLLVISRSRFEKNLPYIPPVVLMALPSGYNIHGWDKACSADLALHDERHHRNK